ncbi:MAG: hypothetical protein ACLQBY_06090 [Solirubrobacteraceae bacterium]
MATPSFEFDIRARTLTLAGEDATTRTFALPAGMFDFETNLERVAVRLDPPELTVGLPNGRHAVVELSDPRRSLEELRAGRPCVYLDQNHWSTIAAAREGRGSITVEQARAAEVLVGLVEDRRILLPSPAAIWWRAHPSMAIGVSRSRRRCSSSGAAGGCAIPCGCVPRRSRAACRATVHSRAGCSHRT